MQLKKLVSLVVGSPEHFQMEHRLRNTVWIVGSLYAFISAILNYLFGFHSIIIWGLAGFSLLWFLFFIWGRKYHRFKTLDVLTFISLLLVIIFGWITNGGSSGGFPPIIFLVASLVALLPSSRKILFLNSIIVFCFWGLLIFEYLYPDKIVLYDNRAVRFVDVGITYILTLIAIVTGINMLIRLNTEYNSKLSIAHEIIKDEKNKLEIKNTIMANEFQLAKNIQNSLIPTSLPVDTMHVLYKPTEEVSGDFYDCFYMPDSNRIGIFICDVSGHGVPAAFITSMIKTSILQSGKKIEDPSQLLSNINNVLQNIIADNFITAFYGIYNPLDNTLIFSNAGHPQPYVITPENVWQLKKGKNTPLGILSNEKLGEMKKTYENIEVQLPKNSKLLLYTDGLTEACRIDNKLMAFENQNMLNIFNELIQKDCVSFIDTLFARLVAFRGSNSFEDDICIICLDVT